MSTAIRRTLLLLAWGSASFAAQADSSLLADGVHRTVGYATSLSTGEPVYQERHRIEVVNGRIDAHEVDYRAPDGSALCRKTISYARGPYLPEFRMEDSRDAYVEGAAFDDDQYRVFRTSPNSATRSASFNVGPNHVADAGFDGFVRANMDRLLSGDALSFTFIVAGYLDAVSFRARLDGTSEIMQRSAATFVVEPDSLLRFFVEPIRVSYDTGRGELLVYEGVTNIRDDKGKRHRARITYPPSERSHQPFPS